LGKIVSIATGVPTHKHQQQDIFKFANSIYCKNETDSRKLQFLYNHSGITTRYSVIPDYNLSTVDRQFYSPDKTLEPIPDIEKRMLWYFNHAAPLSVNTIRKCIVNKISPKEITHLITVSCTGMSAPGLDLQIMEAMELPCHIFRMSVNFMGCYAAVHALRMANDICNANNKANVVIVCTELCTLHFQTDNSIDNITSTLLFGDGCAAVLVQQNNTNLPGLTLQNFFSNVAFKGKNDMSWAISSKGFLMTLSGYVPELILEDFDDLFNQSLASAQLSKQDITHWCIHPGGKKILEVIEKSISLPKESLRYSYEILNDYGNMSSATILFVLENMLNDLLKNSAENTPTVFSAAFGPGLTMETFIATYD
jgi:predicted naringenin-chalcone synthase